MASCPLHALPILIQKAGAFALGNPISPLYVGGCQGKETLAGVSEAVLTSNSTWAGNVRRSIGPES